jgi:hypothetical protein
MWRARRLRPRLGRWLPPTVLLACLALLSGSSAPVSSAQTVGCARELDGVFWGGAQWLRLGDAIAANPSPCVDYYISLLPQDGDRTQPPIRARFDELRALHPSIHPLAEMHWEGERAWRAWVVGGHPLWVPGRTFYEAGVTARRRMAMRGLDVEAGETWAFNELPPEVLAGAPGARAEVLEFMRGLYDGAPGMPKARGIVFNVFVPSTSEPAAVAAYKEALKAWLADEAFWTELDRYVDVFANEVYVSSRNWGVSGAPLAKRAKRMNDYFQHMALLADDAPKELQAAAAFLRRTYLPLANAIWPSTVGDTQFSADLMKHYVSSQVYALRQFAEGHPGLVPQHLVGFAWAPLQGGAPFYSTKGRDEIAARLVSAIHDSIGEASSAVKDACGVPERIWCEGEVPGAEFNGEWRIFDSWK